MITKLTLCRFLKCHPVYLVYFGPPGFREIIFYHFLINNQCRHIFVFSWHLIAIKVPSYYVACRLTSHSTMNLYIFYKSIIDCVLSHSHIIYYYYIQAKFCNNWRKALFLFNVQKINKRKHYRYRSS